MNQPKDPTCLAKLMSEPIFKSAHINLVSSIISYKGPDVKSASWDIATISKIL